MRVGRALVGGLVAAALIAAPVSSASAGWRHHHDGRGIGLVGGLIIGAATIATLPLAIVAGAAGPPPGRPYYNGLPPGYYGPPGGYYGPPQGYYGPPPAYGPPPGYPPPQYYGPPPGY